MIRASCSKVHLRLVKKLPGQPPSGAIVPCGAPGELPRFMRQAPLPAALSFQRPARSTGGGAGAAGAGGGALACGSGLAATRSLVAHAASVLTTSNPAAALAARAPQNRIPAKLLIGNP